jgi:hypothetical protein
MVLIILACASGRIRSGSEDLRELIFFSASFGNFVKKTGMGKSPICREKGDSVPDRYVIKLIDPHPAHIEYLIRKGSRNADILKLLFEYLFRVLGLEAVPRKFFS